METIKIIVASIIVCIILILIIDVWLYLNTKKLDEIYVLKTSIISNYNEDGGTSPIVITRYFLAREKQGKYYELFSNALIKEKEAKGGNFNIPYIENVEPLKKYINYPKDEIIENEVLFEILLELNMDETVKAIISKENANDNNVTIHDLK